MPNYLKVESWQKVACWIFPQNPVVYSIDYHLINKYLVQ